jgi:hypothetical protein
MKLKNNVIDSLNSIKTAFLIYAYKTANIPKN